MDCPFLLALELQQVQWWQYSLSHIGEELWAQRVDRTVKSDGSDFGVFGRLIDAAVTAAFTDQLEIASRANDSALASLPVGDDHPEYPRLQEKIARWKKKHGR